MTDKKLIESMAKLFKTEFETFKTYKYGDTAGKDYATALELFCKGSAARMIQALKAEGYAIGEDAEKV